MKALLSNYHQPPRKVALVADLIRGKSVTEARAALMYLPKKSAPALSKLLESAVANARGRDLAPEQLFVKAITVNKGLVMRRLRPFARGRGGTMRKMMSIVSLELGTNAALAPKTAKTHEKGEKKAARSTPKAAKKKTTAKAEK